MHSIAVIPRSKLSKAAKRKIAVLCSEFMSFVREFHNVARRIGERVTEDTANGFDHLSSVINGIVSLLGR